MTEEHWRDACGYEEYFLVSTFGRVISKRTNKILRQSFGHNGYSLLSTKLHGRAGGSVCIRVHRLVAMTFIPNVDNQPCVNHLDGDKNNNTVDNLEWCSHAQNTKHAFDLGLAKPRLTSLTCAQQDIATGLKLRDGLSNRKIAKVMGVGVGVIHRFMRRVNVEAT